MALIERIADFGKGLVNMQLEIQHVRERSEELRAQVHVLAQDMQDVRGRVTKLEVEREADRAQMEAERSRIEAERSKMQADFARFQLEIERMILRMERTSVSEQPALPDSGA